MDKGSGGMYEKGFIALWRSLMKWKWYKSPNVKNLFIHMLLRANYEDGYWDGRKIPRGSFVSSIGNLAEETGLTVDEVRTALKKLLEEEVTKQSTNKYSIYTVVNYELYQDVSQSNPKQNPSNAQTIPNLFPTIEQRNKENKETNIYDGDSRACDIAVKLFNSYWDRKPSEDDIDRVWNLISDFDRGNVCVSEDKEQLLEYAFRSSASANVRNWNYIVGILDNLRARNIHTIDEAYEYEIQTGKG